MSNPALVVATHQAYTRAYEDATRILVASGQVADGKNLTARDVAKIGVVAAEILMLAAQELLKVSKAYEARASQEPTNKAPGT